MVVLSIRFVNCFATHSYWFFSSGCRMGKRGVKYIQKIVPDFPPSPPLSLFFSFLSFSHFIHNLFILDWNVPNCCSRQGCQQTFLRRHGELQICETFPPKSVWPSIQFSKCNWFWSKWWFEGRFWQLIQRGKGGERIFIWMENWKRWRKVSRILKVRLFYSFFSWPIHL